MAAPSKAQLQAQVRALVERYPEQRLLAFHGNLGADNPAKIEVAGRDFEVVEVLSPLHLCELAQLADSGQAVVCLCPERDWVLEDVQERVAGGQLQELDPWRGVMSDFHCADLEPRLRRQKELAHWILDGLPLQSPGSPGLVLTEEFCWSVLLKERLGLDPDCQDPVQFLAWAGNQSVWEASVSASPLLIARASEWLHKRGGPLPAIFLRLLPRLAPIDLIGLGIVCETISRSVSNNLAVKASGGLELYLDSSGFQASQASSWADATRRLLRSSPSLPSWWGAAVSSAHQILSRIKASELASESQILPEGSGEILSRIAQSLLAQEPPSRQDMDALQSHHLADTMGLTFDRIDVSTKILRYLKTETAPCPRLGESVDQYQDHHAWADRAELFLLSEEAHLELHKAFLYLNRQLLEHRKVFDKQFATVLAQWNQQGSPAKQAVAVEDLLSRIAAPLIVKRRILLLVLDGCSWPVLISLLADLRQLHWHHYLPKDPTWRRLISGLPSVTEVSRCSLLSGSMVVGNATLESQNFSKQPAILAPCRKDYPPVVFHKADLEKEATYAKIAGEEHKAVALVINTIDDTLSKEDHLNLQWSSQLLKHLQRVLQSAYKSQRAVLLVSDHGHVLEQGTTEFPSHGAGNRWQPGTKEQEGTTLFQGGRLQLAEQARLAWDSQLRFGPKKRGYHGGASPAEAVCSVALLAATGQKIDGWTEGQLQPPDWWWEPRREVQWLPHQAEHNLFQGVSQLSFRLQESPGFKMKVRLNGKPPAGWDTITDYLAGYPDGVSTRQLAAQLGISEPQAFDRLSVYQKWLRVDGVDVVEVRPHHVKLSQSGLRKFSQG